MNESALHALSLWTGLHLLLMLGLALNVTRHRLNAGKEGFNEERLSKAVRAHGNNIEYVPIILVAIAMLVALGNSSVWVHTLCGILFIARLSHAYGIQQFGSLPKTRVIGNMGTWGVMLVSAIALVIEGLGS